MPNDFHSTPLNPHHSPLTSADAAIIGALDRAEPVAGPPDDAALARQSKNDLGNARRLIARHGDSLKFCDAVGPIAYNVTHWDIENGHALALMLAHDTSEAVMAEREAEIKAGQREGETDEEFEERVKKLGLWSIASGNRSRAEAMLISAAPYLRAKLETFDADPWALNVANGILRLNEPRVPDSPAPLYPHAPGARMTKICPVAYDPLAECPRWRKYISEVFEGADDVALYVQKVLGYALSGDIGEQKMWFFFGAGRNGKSTIVQVVSRILGTYSALTPVATFLNKEHESGSGPSPDIARLPGVRLLRTSEPKVGARLDESIVKQISSGEPMAARHLRKDFFEFKPACKVIFSTNHKPTIVGKDEGIRRRIVLVPFMRQFPVNAQRGVSMENMLLQEAPGILNWLLEGLALWFDEGLDMPPAVAAATKAYFDEMDPIGGFVAECCQRVPECRADDTEQATLLFRAYEAWCRQNNETPREQTAFGRRMNDLGHPVKRGTGGVTYRIGLKLRPEFVPQMASRLGEEE